MYLISSHEWGTNYHVIAIEVRYVHVDGAIHSWCCNQGFCSEIYGGTATNRSQL